MEIAPLITEPTMLDRLRRQLDGLMSVDGVEVRQEPDRVIVFHGRVLGDVEAAFDRLSERLATLDYTAMLIEAEPGPHQLLAIRGVVQERPRRRWINLFLFALTVVSTMFTGLSLRVDFGSAWWYFSGLPFAASLLAILLAHEFAHYFVGRRYGSPLSLPYFIPMPLGILGTMGAVIFQRTPMRDRKALFDIGIAGPLAGLAVAIPLLFVGLAFTRVDSTADGAELEALQQQIASQCARADNGLENFFCSLISGENVTNIREGNSLLYLAAKYLMKGKILPNEAGEDVQLSWPPSPGGPVVFAAWAGLLVTALNLLPIGQLDGGHVAYALLGRRAWTLAYAVIGMMGMLALYLGLNGNPAAVTWGVWVGLAALFGPRHPPPLNDVTRLGARRVLLGILLLVIFVLIFVPVPLVEVPLS
ncbi:MAG: site-2 protease family protein [Anaerolineae bacterium]|nr:site-2 protease family protein [Anaerolineae bacterium]